VTCEWCQRGFLVDKPRIATARFCSRTCKGAHARTRTGPRSALWQRTRVLRTCQWCGGEFRVTPHIARTEPARFCSRGCADAWRTDPTRPRFDRRAYWHEWNVKRQAWIANAPGTPLTYDEWLLIKQGQDYRCKHCGRREPDIKLTRDHIVPVSKGGSVGKDNVQGLCQPCNSRKHNKPERRP
jgi:5-methylcytosine-specific restriction endonuclease McrA